LEEKQAFDKGTNAGWIGYFSEKPNISQVLIEIIKGSAIFVISFKTELNLVNLLDTFYHKFKLVESTCIKVISPVFLDNAMVWSNTRKNTEL
jgi:hypothetical protein